MIDFSDSSGGPTPRFEELRQWLNLGKFIPEVTVQIINANLIWPTARHQGGPARIAERQLTVGSLKADSSLSQLIDVGCLGNLVAIASQGICQIINGNHEDVWLLYRVCRRE